MCLNWYQIWLVTNGVFCILCWQPYIKRNMHPKTKIRKGTTPLWLILLLLLSYYNYCCYTVYFVNYLILLTWRWIRFSIYFMISQILWPIGEWENFRNISSLSILFCNTFYVNLCLQSITFFSYIRKHVKLVSIGWAGAYIRLALP